MQKNKYSSFISLPEMNTLGMITLRLKNFFNNVRTIHFPLYNVTKALRFSSRRRRGGKGGRVGRRKKEKKKMVRRSKISICKIMKLDLYLYITHKD